MVSNVRLLLVVSVKLREYAADVVDHQLRQLPIMILDDKAKELAMLVMNYIADFLFKWKGC